MTSYSVLSSQGKATVIATWPSQWADSRSAKVTTFSDLDLAVRLADDLTWLSETMWHAAAWLDVYEPAETALAQLIEDLRATTDVPQRAEPDFSACRHSDATNADEVAFRIVRAVPETANLLTRAQRLSVADELAADAEARRESVVLLPTGHDPEEADSRVWQAAAVTRATHTGLTGSLPDGGSGWVVRLFDTDHGPAERWGARTVIARLEQLVADVQSIGARARVDDDPLKAHLVFPLDLFGIEIDREPDQDFDDVDDETPTDGGVATRAPDRVCVDGVPVSGLSAGALCAVYREWAANTSQTRRGYTRVDDAIVTVAATIDQYKVPRWERDVFAPLEVSVRLRKVDGSGYDHVLTTVDAADTEGLVAALGEWAGMSAIGA